MSNIGQIALTVVGTVVGAYFGNPELGFALGSLAGQALFPTQLPDGPKITDNRTTTASLGVPVAFGFGTFSVSGTFIFAGKIVQSSQQTSTKGGPQQKTYSYTQTVAVGLCEAVRDGATAIGGVTRIWENGTLVYDIRPKQGFNTQTGVLAETDTEYHARLTASALYKNFFTLYLGSETQTADPAIQAEQGIGNVGAYRGLAYVVFPNRVLRVSQGLRHPNFQFEVASHSVGHCVDEYLTDVATVHPWLSGDARTDLRNPLNKHVYFLAGVDYPTALHSAGGTVGGVADWQDQDANGQMAYATFDAVMARIQYVYGFPMDIFIGSGTTPVDGQASVGVGMAGIYQIPMSLASDDRQKHALRISLNYSPVAVSPDHFYGNLVGNEPTAPPFTLGPNVAWYANSAPIGQMVALNQATTPTQHEYGANTPSHYGTVPSPFLHVGAFGYGDPPTYSYWYTYVGTAGVFVERLASAPASPCYGKQPSPYTGFCYDDDGVTLIKNQEWTPVPPHGADGSQWAILRNESKYSYNGHKSAVGPAKYYPRGGAQPTDESERAYWEAAYTAAVSNGTMDGGLTFGSDYPQISPFDQDIYEITVTTCTGTSDAVTVGEIIRAVCSRAGYTDAQIDATDMDNRTVDGYAISSICSGNAIIMPLRSIAFFDAVESQGVLRFQSRGKALSATLTLDDLGAYDVSGGGQNVPPAIQISRTMDVELPRQIRVHYVGTQRDYQQSEQDSLFRLTTAAVNDQDVQLPYAIKDTQALQAADILWNTAWAERNQYTLAVDQSWAALEPGDCIAIPVEGLTRRVRIGSLVDSSGVLRKLQCVDDDAAAYVSQRVAEANPYQPGIIPAVYQSQLFILDLPALQDADSNSGFYMAACRDGTSIGNQWAGTTVYKSVDDATFAESFSITTEAVAGITAAPLPDGGAYTWDDSLLIDVTLADPSMTLESRTDDAVLSGANACVIGADGRWEILQFANAVLDSGSTWRLSRILRGRKGTEFLTGTHQAGDTFVLLKVGTLWRMPMNISERGLTRFYKSVSIGMDYATGVDHPFAGQAVALRTFAPVHSQMTVQSGGDLYVTWIRRDRLGRTFMLGNSDAPLAFSIDVLSSAGAVLRTLTSSATNLLYSATQQRADHSGALATSLRLAIFQLSATNGQRGTPLVCSAAVGSIGSTAAMTPESTFIPGPAPTITSSASWPVGTTDQAYSQTVTASGGDGFYTVELVSGIPDRGLRAGTGFGFAGMTYSTNRVMNYGTSSFVIRVRDSAGHVSANQTVTWVKNLAAPAAAVAAGCGTQLYAVQPKREIVSFTTEAGHPFYYGLYYQDFPPSAEMRALLSDSEDGFLKARYAANGTTRSPYIAGANHDKTTSGSLPMLSGANHSKFCFRFKYKGSTNAYDVLMAMWALPLEHSLGTGPYGEFDLMESHFAAPAAKATFLDWFNGPSFTKVNHDNYGTQPPMDFTQEHSVDGIWDFTNKTYTVFNDNVHAFTVTWAGAHCESMMATARFYPIMDLTSGHEPNGTAADMTIYEVSAWVP